MRPAVLLGLCAVGIAAGVAGSARADVDVAVPPPEGPFLSSLPPAPADARLERPARVEGSEQVRGLWASVPREVASYYNRGPQPAATQAKKKLPNQPPRPPQQPQTAKIMTVAPSPLVTTLGTTGTYPVFHVAPGPDTGVCLRTSGDGTTWTSTSGGAVLLESAPGARIQVDNAEVTRMQIRENLWLVRAERLVEAEGDQVTLEGVDAWVDLRTGGAREARRTATVLSLVQRMPGGLTLYGARVQGDRAIFVLRPPPVPRAPEAHGDTPAPEPPSLKLDAGEGQPGHCRFARVEVALDTTGQSGSEIVGGEISAPIEGDPDVHAVRIRPFRVSLGLSRLTAEASPAVSASWGWTGRTRVEARDP